MQFSRKEEMLGMEIQLAQTFTGRWPRVVRRERRGDGSGERRLPGRRHAGAATSRDARLCSRSAVPDAGHKHPPAPPGPALVRPSSSRPSAPSFRRKSGTVCGGSTTCHLGSKFMVFFLTALLIIICAIINFLIIQIYFLRIIISFGNISNRLLNWHI